MGLVGRREGSGRGRGLHAVACDGVACDAVACDGVACDAVACDGVACDGVACDGVACDGGMRGVEVGMVIGMDGREGKGRNDSVVL